MQKGNANVSAAETEIHWHSHFSASAASGGTFSSVHRPSARAAWAPELRAVVVVARGAPWPVGVLVPPHGKTDSAGFFKLIS